MPGPQVRSPAQVICVLWNLTVSPLRAETPAPSAPEHLGMVSRRVTSLVQVTGSVQLLYNQDLHTELILNICALKYSKDGRKHIEWTLSFSKRFITNWRK